MTLNVGVVQGGTRTNVIPAEAKALVDVRVTRVKDAAVIDRKLRFLKPFNRECKLEFAGGVNRPPMERTQAVAALYKKAFDIAKQLGWKLEEAWKKPRLVAARMAILRQLWAFRRWTG